MSSTHATAADLRPAARPSAGYTLLETIVASAVVATLAGLLFPALQGAREAARLSACRNNVRHIALSVLQNDLALEHMPSGGWGSTWLGVAERVSDSGQPGSWIYGILPFIEAAAVHDVVAGATATTAEAAYRTCAASPVPTFTCPSRRTPEARTLSAAVTYRTASGKGLSLPTGVVSDYAANGGSTATCPPLDLLEKALAYVDGSTKVTFCHVPNDDPLKQNTQSLSLSATEQGHDGHATDHIGPCFTCGDDMATVAIDPDSLSQGDQWRRIQPLGRLVLPDGGIPDLQDGIVARMSQVRAAAIRDGLSNTYLVGEKYVAADRYDGTDAGDDRVMMAGYSSGNVRWAYDPPAQDATGQSQPNVFGSAHRAGWTVAFADGSVQTLGFDIDPAIHKLLAARADGRSVTRPE